MRVTEEQWSEFQDQGFLRLGKVLNQEDLRNLTTRIDEIMLGRAGIDYDRLLMQLDSSDGLYENLSEQTSGHKGPSLNYRKIQDLEFDPLFLEYIQRPIFREFCSRVYGPETEITCFRAMFMNKPARRGTFLPWHQDRWKHLDRDPRLSVWTALDPATCENGCVQILPGSHHWGVVNPDNHSGFLTDDQVAERVREEEIQFLELEPGEAVVLDNWTLHCSDINRSEIPRRAFSVCYMDSRTRGKEGEVFSLIFGEGALSPENLRTSV